MPTAALLSGGVDSSVALLRVAEEAQREGAAPPIAFYLKIWLEDELAHLGHCPWEEDLRYARAVCQQAGLELEVVSLQRRYQELVVSWALDELRAGRTPSPDVLCNRRVKFGAFFEILDELGDFPKVASGHYAGLQTGDDGIVRLLRGLDPVKDQTYFLFRLTQAQLRRTCFPLGSLQKSEVRQEAERLGLPTRHRKDSQGICFLGKLRFEEFVRAHLGDRPGPIRDTADGKILGEHRGHWFFTIGQRKGLGLGGGPWFVVEKEAAADTIWVTHGDTLEAHRRSRFLLRDVHWIAGAAPRDLPTSDASGLTHIGLRLRHGPNMANASLELGDPAGGPHPATGDTSRKIPVKLEVPDPGVAPGQVAVLYHDRICLGGGEISLL